MGFQPDWSRIMDVGVSLAVENARRGAELTAEAAMWELLREAAQTTSIAYQAPPRTGFPIKSLGMEGGGITPWQMMAAYLRGEVSEMPSEETRAPRPSAEQITRAECVLDLWHREALKDRGDWSKMRKAVYLKACGVPDRKIRAVTGFSRQRIHNAKKRAMRDMLDGLTSVTL